MSRRIDPYRPFTEEEKQHLRTRAAGDDLIQANERRFGDLSDEDKEKLRQQAEKDEKSEEPEPDVEEEDEYHPDDIAQVEDLTVKDLRLRLDKEGLRTTVTSQDQAIPGSGDSLTEKQVLAYRLLDFLDDRRKKGQK